MDYRASLDFLYGLQRFGIKLGLDNMLRMLDRLGHPERSYFCVHIAGTNGKGSTAVTLETILRQAGWRTGLYTSPHLVSFTERIRVDGVPVEESQVAELTADLRRMVEDVPATFFEFATAMALEHFRRAQVDIAILETGMGGRLDATNAVRPGMSLITRVALDHQQYLGDSLAGVAVEKAGIIKKGVPVLSSPQEDEVTRVLRQRTASLDAPLLLAGADWRTVAHRDGTFDYLGRQWCLRRLRPALAGRHQVDNAALALAAAEQMASRFHLEAGQAGTALEHVVWPGRLQRITGPPELLLDGAHNPDGMARLVEYLEQRPAGPRVWLAAFKNDKDWQAAVTCMAAVVDRIVCVPLRGQESAAPERVAASCRALGLAAETAPSASAGLGVARRWASASGQVVVAGSLFLVGEVLAALAAEGSV